MATSASTILTRARAILQIDSNSGIPGLEDSHLLAMLNAANYEYVNAFRKGGGEPPDFMRAETGGTLVADTDLDESGGVATTDTTLDLTSATNAISSGGGIVVYDEDMPDIVYYTSKSSNQLTGVTGIGFAHEDADTVSFLYALPSNFHDLRQTEGYGDGVRVNGVNYTFTSGVPTGTQFSLVNNAGAFYLWFPRSASGDYSVFYNKTVTTINDAADNIDIPDTLPTDQMFVVLRLVEQSAPLLENFNLSGIARGEAQVILRDALKTKHAGKRVRLLQGARSLNSMAGGSNQEFYNPRVGSYGFYS